MRISIFLFLCMNFATLQLLAQNAASPAPRFLSLAEAQKIALEQHPELAIAKLQQKIEQEKLREARSYNQPQFTASITAVQAEDASRLTAGFLNNPSLYTRAAAGISVTQLITDFGRTHHLIQGQREVQLAQKERLRGSEDEIRLAVSEAYYRALIASKLQEIAEQAVKDRQTLDDEVTALTRAKLKSTLDQSFADAELSQAEL